MTQDITTQERKPRAKVAQLVAESVNVLCPECGEPQPDPEGGSHLWLPAQVEGAQGHHLCVACDAHFVITTRRTVQFL